MRLLAIIEANTVTGPAKNLIDFCLRARELPPERRVETSILTFARGRTRPTNSFLEAVRAAGIPVDCILQRSIAESQTLERIRSIFARVQPDVMQTHAIKSHFLMRMSGLWKQRPWIAFHHGYTVPDFKMRLYNQLDRWSLRKPVRIVTVSRAFEQQLIGQGVAPSRIAVLHNSIEPNWPGAIRPDDTAGLRRLLGISERDRVLLTVGRLSREKAHTDLIAAARKLIDLDPGLPVRVIVVGDGPERVRIERAAREMGIADRIVMTGHVDDPRPYYTLANAVVIPSLTEGSPNALLEAMAAGVPVVATHAGGIPEIVTHEESALLVPPRQPAVLAEAIARTLAESEPARLRALRARSLIEIRHSPDARARYLADLYHDAVHHADRH